MPHQHPRRLSSVLVSALAAAGIGLAAAGCGQVTPLGPTPPQPSRLGTPIVLQVMRAESATPAGRCPAGSVRSGRQLGVGIGWKPLTAQPAGPPKASRAPVSQCYRKVGPPVSLTSAAISPVFEFQPPAPPGGGPVPTQYGFTIILPPAGAAVLTTVTTRAFHSRGYLDISIAGKIVLLPQVPQPFTSPLRIFLATRNRALRLRGTLVRPS